MKITLKERLVRYLQRNHGWIASGDLQRLVVAHTDYTPRTAVRRLEELAEEGELEVKYVKGHAWYRVKQEPSAADLLATNNDRLRAFEMA